MKKPLYWILIAVFGVIFLISGYFVVSYLIESHDNKQLQQELIDLTKPNSTSSTTESVGTTDFLPTGADSPTVPIHTQPVILDKYQALYELNNHMVGWIYIPGSENPKQNNNGVNYPVLQTPNEVEWHNYYLYRDFYGEDDKHGWIYAREACDIFKPCDNIVIYGHNMADGTMFGQVVNYRKESYYQEHKYIHFDTLYEEHVYEIIAVFLTSGTTGEGYTYHSRNYFATEEEFNEFINAIKGGDPRVKIYYNIDTTAEFGDKLITLSTCWKEIEDGRLVVVAKRIS